METRNIKADISLCKPNHEPFLFENGTITISDDSIVVSGCLDSQHEDRFSIAYKAAIDLHSDFAKYVKYKNAYIEGQHVNIIGEEETRVLSPFRTCSIAGGTQYTWSLSKISFSYTNARKENFVVINIPFENLANTREGFANSSESLTLANNAFSLNLRKATNANHTIVDTENLPQNFLSAFLVHTSFYFYSLCDIIEQSTYCDGKQIVKIQIPNFENTKVFSCLPELHFVQFGERRSFNSFFLQSQWSTLQDNEKENLKNAVYTLARCQYCDETTEFLLLYSVLDRYVGNSHGINPYPAMEEKLAERNINIEKIGPKTDSSMQKLKLNLVRDNGSVVGVANFCNLRNYIMHFMANASIAEFLRKSHLISNMRVAVTVILLQEFGFHDIYFPKDWSHLSVLLHNRE